MKFALLLALFVQDADEKKFMSALGQVTQKLREQVAPAVVAIDVDRSADPDGKSKGGGAARGYFERPEGPTSGTILSADGEIMTSHFNVSGTIRKIVVTLHDGRKLEAKLLGYDKARDLALLKIDAKDLPVLKWANLDDVKQGDLVATVGRSPNVESATINVGILSATYRFNGSHVQTDAELNYGNVGGPLVNLKGELIGVTCKISPKQAWGQSGGVGFAARTEQIDRSLAKLRKGENIEKEEKPYIGILAAASSPRDGVKIQDVLAGSPAEQAGLEEGDIITHLNGKPVKNINELRAEVRKQRIGAKVKVKYLRGDAFEEKEIEVEIADDPNQ